MTAVPGFTTDLIGKIIEEAVGLPLDVRLAFVDDVGAPAPVSPVVGESWTDVDHVTGTSEEHLRTAIASAAVTLVNMLPVRRWRSAYVSAAASAAISAAGANHVAFLLSDYQLTSERFAAFRSTAREHRIEWLIWGTDGVFTWVLLIAQRHDQSTTGPVTRIVEGRSLTPDELCARVRACARRGGGSVGETIVRREALPLNQPWTWDVLSGAQERRAQDLAALGALADFEEFVDSCRLGIRTAGAPMRELEDGEPIPDGHVGLILGSQIRREALLPTMRAVARSAVRDADAVLAGDLLIPRVTRLPLRVVAAADEVLPAVHADTVIRVRLRQEISPERRRLLLEYLRSERFGSELASRAPTLGEAVHLSAATLLRTPVPRFDESFVEAMTQLSSAEAQFKRWADVISATRNEFFSASSFQKALPPILERGRTAADQVAAAADVETLDGRIRHRFPHPLAYRYESLQQLEHGAERMRETLACAEHLVLFLAFVGLANLGGGTSASLRAWSAERGELTLDWGKADVLLREAAAKTAKLPDPLAAPAPELGTLHPALADMSSSLSKALGELRAWRNDEAHLTRLPPDEVVATSERSSSHLREVFSAAAMLTRTPLVVVEALGRDPVSDEQRARFAYLVGVSSVFARRWQHPGGAESDGQVGILDVHGRFHRLNPWLLRRTCDRCKHSETFVLSRCGKDVKYVAMESGHPLVGDESLAAKLRTFIARERERGT